jgi:hypothetical protein
MKTYALRLDNDTNSALKAEKVERAILNNEVTFYNVNRLG